MTTTIDDATMQHCAYAADAARARGHSVDCQWQHDGQAYWCQCSRCHGPVVVVDGVVHAIPACCTGDDAPQDDDDGSWNPDTGAWEPGPLSWNDDTGAPSYAPQEPASAPTDGDDHDDASATPAPAESATAAIPVQSIWLNRAEGPTAECGDVTVSSYDDADRVLQSWARTAPDTGGYDKCDFRITFADGETYEGRYDLKRHDTAHTGQLQRHVRQFCRFYAGLWRPVHITPEYYERDIIGDTEQCASFKRFLDTYDLGDGHDESDLDATLLGYAVESLDSPRVRKMTAYKLHGPRVTYTLMREVNRPHLLYALNSHGNVCAIKGNYRFSDETGTLRTVN